MRDPTTWIKLDRNIRDWRWASDANTLSVFIHLLIRASVSDRPFNNITLNRGDVAITQEELATVTGLTRQKVRRALDNLISTKDITKSQHGRTVVISIPRYDAYQQVQPNSQPRNNQIEIGRNVENSTLASILSNKEEKEKRTKKEKEEKELKESLSLSLSHRPGHIPSIEEVREYERTSERGKDPELFYRHYQRENWRANGKPVYDWRRLYDNWQPPETTLKLIQNRPKRFTDSDGITYEWRDGNYEKVRE